MTARIPRPFEGVYGISLLTAILALVPYIIVTSAYALFRREISQDIGAGATGLEIINGSGRNGLIVGRIFALVELVRSVADFILAPVMLGVARVASGAAQPNAEGLRLSIWLTLGVTIALTLGGVALYLLGGAGLPRPDLVAWIDRNQPAIASPPLAQTLRGS